MIAPDVNLLIYAVDRGSPSHEAAQLWLGTVLAGSETVGFSWGVITAFVRITPRRRMMHQPLTIEEAFDIMTGWLSHPHAAVIHPGPAHFDLLRDLMLQSGGGAPLVSDADLAAVAIANNAGVYSTDSDFARFQGVRWRNPLA